MVLVESCLLLLLAHPCWAELWSPVLSLLSQSLLWSFVVVNDSSSVVCGLAGAVCLVDAICCLDALPSARSSATSRFTVGNGNGALAICVEGADAIGTSVMTGCCPLCFGGCAVVAGNAPSCCEGVCVSVVVCGLATIFAVGCLMKPDASGVVIGGLLMASKAVCCASQAWLAFWWPSTWQLCWLIKVSLPCQIAGKNLASIFGICFAVGNM